jgi:glycosyltransferase involved in cell wall biosynthesis
MNSAPTLALLIPAYNAAAYLPRLFQSVARQSEAFDEVWVYDDASTDDTAAVAERFGARVVRGEENRGCSAGKNVLAARTAADWLHFHDTDDELYPNFVTLARRWIVDGRFDVVLFPYEERWDGSSEPAAFRIFDPQEVREDARAYAIREQINAICGLYKRDAYLRAGGHDEDPLVLFNEDVAFHTRLAFAGLSFAAENEISIINHRRMDSMSAANRLGCLQAQYHVMRKTAAREDARPYAFEIAQKLWNAAGGLASELDWETADAAAALAAKLADLSAIPSSPVFKTLCRLSPTFALRVREGLIRAMKPYLREGYPGWRASVSLM